MSKKNPKEVVEKEMPEFVSEVVSLSQEELNARLAQLAKDREAVNEAKEQDEELQKARTAKSELEAPYRESVNTIQLKSKYIIGILKDRGQS